MVPLRKARAGSCNLGYTWPEDGSVVEVAPEHAQLLLAVPDGDFSVAASKMVGEPGPELQIEEPAPGYVTPLEEPAPDAPISEAPAPRKAPAKRAAKKTAAPDPEPESGTE